MYVRAERNSEAEKGDTTKEVRLTFSGTVGLPSGSPLEYREGSLEFIRNRITMCMVYSLRVREHGIAR